MKRYEMIIFFLIAALLLTAAACTRPASPATTAAATPAPTARTTEKDPATAGETPASTPASSSASSSAPSFAPTPTPTSTATPTATPTPTPTPTATPTPTPTPTPSSTPTSTPTPTPTPTPVKPAAVYLGVYRYGEDGIDSAHKDSFLFRFFLDGEEARFSLAPTYDENGKATYALQNLLVEGKIYLLTLDGDAVTALEPVGTSSYYGICVTGPDGALTVEGRDGKLPETTYYRITPRAGGASVTPDLPRDGDEICLPAGARCGYLSEPQAVCIPPVSGQPGQKTLKNLFLTALMPIGAALYVYGGGWDWQDVGPAPAARTIGLSPAWIDFYVHHDAHYEYKAVDPTASFYPYGGYNEYYYAGLDCSGFVSWTLYNVFHEKSGEEGSISPSTRYARLLADQGLGVHTRGLTPDNYASTLRAGDVVSIRGHIYFCLGVCEDGSVLILHSTVGSSSAGEKGGGVQFSAIGKDVSCEAWRLADAYTAKYYPEWYSRYPVRLCSPSLYCDCSAENAGFLRFDLDKGPLTDPDGVASLRPAKLLALLFGENG